MQLNEESSWGKRGRSRSRSRGGGEEGARGEKQEQEEEGTQLEVSTGILTYSKVDKKLYNIHRYVTIFKVSTGR